MRSILIAIATVSTLSYPLLVYFGIAHANVRPALFALFFLGIAAIRFQLSQHKNDSSVVTTLAAITLYSIVLAISDSEWVLRLYPVFVSFSVAGLFLVSVFQDESLIERTARLHGQHLSPLAKNYTRKLTAIWGIVLLINGSISFYLALFASREAWALYCGLLSYLCFALLFALEYLYRMYYKARYET